METISPILLTFILNACWQTALVAAVAALAGYAMRKGPASYRYVLWVTALTLGLLLPAAGVFKARAVSSGPQFDEEAIARQLRPAGGAANAGPALTEEGQSAGTRATTAPLSVAPNAAAVLVGLYAAFLFYRIVILWRAWNATRRICRDAKSGVAPPVLESVWRRCAETFGVPDAELLASGTVAGPVTAGLRRSAVILPDRMFGETAESVLLTAVGHEMAHASRRDFAWNLLCEFLHAPVAFHPAAWLMRREIQRAREMACDEMVTRRVMDPGAYARSIVTIAAQICPAPQPGYTLGVFDGDILEMRIKRLMERPSGSLRRARVMLCAGLTALAACGVLATGLAISARAQSSGELELKAAVEADARGDHEAALRRFANAVALDPANGRARLLLGRSLLSHWDPGRDGLESPVLQRAQEQFLSVLSRNPENAEAMSAMTDLKLNVRQFGDARQWAAKVIRVEPRNAAAYYSLGFAAWAEAYGPINRASLAAGMRGGEGLLPDAAQRSALRTQWLPMIEDGLLHLQTAIQIDPDHDDAMAYMNLLYRLKGAIAEDPSDSAQSFERANGWLERTISTKKSNIERGTSKAHWPLPPPPPPPPPPGREGGQPRYGIVGVPNRPGQYYAMAGPTRVLEALMTNDATKDLTAATVISVIREGRELVSFNFRQAVEGNTPEKNILLQAGDMIMVK